MAREPEICPAGNARLSDQRGDNRCVWFAGEDDYVAYVHWLEETQKTGIEKSRRRFKPGPVLRRHSAQEDQRKTLSKNFLP